MSNGKRKLDLVYPGSFDPFTKGHEDIALRAAKLCDTLHILVLNNAQKEASFSLEERKKMIEIVFADYDNIQVDQYNGLLVDYLKKHDLSFVVRGLRSESDFRYETQMAATNSLMYADYDTILLPSRAGFSYTSSSTVKEVAAYGGDISKMVPAEIEKFIEAKFT